MASLTICILNDINMQAKCVGLVQSGSHHHFIEN